MKISVFFLLIFCILWPIRAATEEVLVEAVIEDRVIVQRNNGEKYLLELGVGCISVISSEGKTVLVESQGLFAGVGSHLLIPSSNQKCRIWDSDLIRSVGHRSTDVGVGRKDPLLQEMSPEAIQVYMLALIENALVKIGREPGQVDGLSDKNLEACVERYCKERQISLTEALTPFDVFPQLLCCLMLDMMKMPKTQDRNEQLAKLGGALAYILERQESLGKTAQ